MCSYSPGTYAWTAPETLEDDAFTTASDVYAFGVIVWETITKRVPWEGKTPPQITLKVAKGQRPSPVPDRASVVPPALLDLMQSCWHQDPKARPTFAAIAEEIGAMLAQLAQSENEGDKEEDEEEAVARDTLPAPAAQVPASPLSVPAETEGVTEAAAGAEAGVAEDAEPVEQTVAEFLAAAGIAQFADAIIEYGVETLEDLASEDLMPDNVLLGDDVGMKKLHVKKLRLALAAL